jgi:PIN domain nuclease of toxin-antitoxin system
MCSVNWTEVVQKTLSWGIDIDGLRRDVEGIGLTIVPFTAVDAETSVGLWSPTRPLGLSLADRACLALARRLDLPVLTSDREWARLDVGVVIGTVR